MPLGGPGGHGDDEYDDAYEDAYGDEYGDDPTRARRRGARDEYAYDPDDPDAPLPRAGRPRRRRRRRHLEPHRGGAILALGILGLVVCVICGIIAWVMGNTDLAKMNAGTMDPDGRGLTEAGRICGMVGVILAGIGLLIVFFVATSSARIP